MAQQKLYPQLVPFHDAEQLVRGIRNTVLGFALAQGSAAERLLDTVDATIEQWYEEHEVESVRTRTTRTCRSK